MRRNSSDVTRREVLRRFGLAAGFAALEPGCVASRPSGPGAAIKVVVVTDLTGPIGFAGPLNANIAKLVVDDITAGGGLLGARSTSSSSTARRIRLLGWRRPAFVDLHHERRNRQAARHQRSREVHRFA